MKHGNEKQQFSTGAQRDTASEKTRPGLRTPYAAERVGQIMRKGGLHYGDRNWERGMPFSRVLESLERHLMQWKMGCTDEDHLAQLSWNCEALMHYEEMIKRGLLPKELADMPKYEQQREALLNQKVSKCAIGVDVSAMTATEAAILSAEAGDFVAVPGDDLIFALAYACSPSLFERLSGYERSSGRIVDTPAPEWTYYRHSNSTHPYRSNGQKVEYRATCKNAFVWDSSTYKAGDFDGDIIANKITRAPTFYLSGPMRGIKGHNFPAFDAAAKVGRETHAYNVVSPAEMDRADPSVSDPNDPNTIREYAARDTKALLDLRAENGDGIALLPGWINSKGAMAELMLARWLGLKIVNAETWLPFTRADFDVQYFTNEDVPSLGDTFRQILGITNE